MASDQRSTGSGEHCTVDEVLDFLSYGDSVGSRDVEAHVVECADCADLVGRVSRVYLLVDNWSAARSAELSAKLAVTAALATAPHRLENRNWAENLAGWAKRLAGSVPPILEVRVASAREGGFRFPRLRRDFLLPGSWEFAPGVMAGGEESRLAAIRGVPGASVELRPAREGTVLVVTAPPGAAEAIGGKLVMLIPQESPEQCAIRELKRQNDGSWAASFADLPSGSYLVVIEPGGRSQG